jgi:riboflavin synthase
MFTGLIEEVGAVAARLTEADATELRIDAPRVAAKISLGDSVAVNGCCLTVSALAENTLSFDLLGETLQLTNLKMLVRGDGVNLECAVAAGAALGGHFVQGHVDCTAPIVSSENAGADLRVEIELPSKFAQYVVSKGSIAVNGVSLTIAEVKAKSFAVWIIPHTKEQTNIAAARPGSLVNLEFDILAKYVERMLHRQGDPSQAG